MASGPGKSSGFEVREYIKVLVKRRWTIATFFVIVVTLITLATFMRVPIFRATATLQILPEAPTYVDFKEVVALGSSNYWALKEYYETQFRIIKSRPVAAAVLDELELRGVDPYKDAKDPEAVLIDQIQVEPVKSSQLVQIHAEHSNAELAARLANTVAAVYQKQNLERTKTISNEASKWLEGEQGTMVDRLGESEKTLQKFMEDNKVFSFEERFNTALINLAKFTEALAEARRDRIEAQSLITKYKEMKAKGQAMMIPAVMENALIQDLKNEKILAEKQLAQIKTKYKSGPDVASLEQQIAVLDEKIGAEIDSIVGAVNAQYLVAASKEKELEKAVEDARTAAQQISEMEFQYKALRRDVDSTQSLFEEMQKRAKETEITKNLAANNIVVVSEARVPEHHIRPRRKTIMMLSMLLGLFGGVGLAFLLEFLDNTIKTQADIERITDRPFLGIIPSFQTEEAEGVDDLFCHNHPKSSITESCRAIRTNIAYSFPGRDLKKLLVTSAGPQEGKSTTVINLGVIFAQSGRRVCLVDSDLRRPRLHKAFDIPRDTGLTNYVMGEIPMDGVITKTEVPNLFVIPSGPIPPNPSEMLEGAPMAKMIEELNERFDLVLFDSPPVVAVTDAVVLSKSVDGVVVVVKAGKTTTELFGRAIRQLLDVQSHIVGSVLNDFNVRGEGYRYYYYYHYYRSDEDGTPGSRVLKKRPSGAANKSA